MKRNNVNVRYYSNHKYGRFLQTLLHYWVCLDNKDKTIRKLLLENGANLNATNGFEKSVLHTAVSRGNYEMSEWLLNNGAYVDSQNKNKDTPLHNAANGNIHLCTLLLKQGADPNCKNKDGETPLSHAGKLIHAEVVKLLLTYGGDAARIDFSKRKRKVGMDSSQLMRQWCEQNIICSAGNNSFIRLKHKVPVLTFEHISLTVSK